MRRIFPSFSSSVVPMTTRSLPALAWLLLSSRLAVVEDREERRSGTRDSSSGALSRVDFVCVVSTRPAGQWTVVMTPALIHLPVVS